MHNLKNNVLWTKVRSAREVIEMSVNSVLALHIQLCWSMEICIDLQGAVLPLYIVTFSRIFNCTHCTLHTLQNVNSFTRSQTFRPNFTPGKARKLQQFCYLNQIKLTKRIILENKRCPELQWPWCSAVAMWWGNMTCMSKHLKKF